MNRVAVERKVLSENDRIAERLRDALDCYRDAIVELHRLTWSGQDRAS